MSFVNVDDDPEHVILFKDFIDELGADLIGQELMDKYGTWPMYSKFYDYQLPLFHHIAHGGNSRFGIQRVENGFYQEGIDAPFG